MQIFLSKGWIQYWIWILSCILIHILKIKSTTRKLCLINSKIKVSQFLSPTAF
jgi:hypothetical protein